MIFIKLPLYGNIFTDKSHNSPFSHCWYSYFVNLWNDDGMCLDKVTLSQSLVFIQHTESQMAVFNPQSPVVLTCFFSVGLCEVNRFRQRHYLQQLVWSLNYISWIPGLLGFISTTDVHQYIWSQMAIHMVVKNGNIWHGGLVAMLKTAFLCKTRPFYEAKTCLLSWVLKFVFLSKFHIPQLKNQECKNVSNKASYLSEWHNLIFKRSQHLII